MFKLVSSSKYVSLGLWQWYRKQVLLKESYGCCTVCNRRELYLQHQGKMSGKTMKCVIGMFFYLQPASPFLSKLTARSTLQSSIVIYRVKKMNFYLHGLISFSSGTSCFPFQHFFSPFLQTPPSYRPWQIFRIGQKRGKFKKYMDEGEGNGNRTQVEQTEHRKKRNCFKG